MEQRNLLKELILKSIRRGGLPDLPQFTSALPAKKARPVIRSAPRILSAEAQCLQPKLSKKFPADFFSVEQEQLKENQKKSQHRLSKRSMHLFKRVSNHEGSTLKQLLALQPPQKAQIIQQQPMDQSMYSTPNFQQKEAPPEPSIFNPLQAFKENIVVSRRPTRSQSQKPQKEKQYTIQQDGPTGYQQTFRIRRLL